MSDLAQTEFDRALGLSTRPARENAARLRSFVTRFAALREDTDVESEILQVGRILLADLIAHDDWLPEAFAAPGAQTYQPYLLHCDSAQRFAVVSYVWGPGQSTPVHDHTVWGLIGVLRGAHLRRRFTRDARGSLIPESPERLAVGSIVDVSPSLGDIHQVSNAHIDRVSISIHVYGANMGALERHSYDETGRPQRFVSGYANRTLPNIWSKP
jgi:predicted metal-dependent enzyme (double-stranded beta helix superfamily)